MIYQPNDFVFLKSLKKKAKIREINEETQTVRLSYWAKDNKLCVVEVYMADIEPLRPKKQRDVVLFAKVKPSAIIPTKRDEDGCYDIYACVEQDEIVILPHEIATIPTGIASAFKSKYRFDVQRERGSTGSIGLVPRCGQIDSGYRGEWFLKIQNVNDKVIVISNKVEKTTVTVIDSMETIIYPMTKAICQAALEIVPLVDTKEIPYSELEKIPSERGKGKLGASGK